MYYKSGNLQSMASFLFSLLYSTYSYYLYFLHCPSLYINYFIGELNTAMNKSELQIKFLWNLEVIRKIRGHFYIVSATCAFLPICTIFHAPNSHL